MHIGLPEILLILAVALLVLGPDKFPKFMSKLGGALKDLKKYTGELTEDIKENVIEPLDEAQRPLREAIAPIEELNESIKKNVKEVEDGLKGVGKKEPKKESKEEPATEPVAEAAEEPEVTETEATETEVASTEPTESADSLEEEKEKVQNNLEE